MTFFSLALVAGYFNGSSYPTKYAELGLALSAFFCFWTSVYVLNDLSDLDVDRINGLNRPLPRGRARPSQYRLAFGTLSLVGILLSLVLPIGSGICLLGCWVLGVSYSVGVEIKRLPGFSLLPPAGSFSLLIISGSFLRGEITTAASFLSAVMFVLVSIAGNVKDLGDVAGDRYGGRRTIAMTAGVKTTALLNVLTSVIIGGLVVLSFKFLPLSLIHI